MGQSVYFAQKYVESNNIMCGNNFKVYGKADGSVKTDGLMSANVYLWVVTVALLCASCSC